MSASREILTLQFGNYANYIGTHWWNIQESSFNYDPSAEPSDIDHDVLYREGKNYKGQTTYTPRLLLVALRGSLGHMPEDGTLYENYIANISAENAQLAEGEDKWRPVKEKLAWDPNSVEVIEKPTAKKPEFLNDLEKNDKDINVKDYKFSSTVTSWTDYMYARYHPRTVNILREYEYSPDKESFDTFSNGVEVWKSDQFRNTFSDQIRQYIEECDACQGFQTIFDCYNGFSGLAFECLRHLTDEYSRATLSIPVFSPKSVPFVNADDNTTDSIRIVNTTLAYSKLFEQSSLILPLSTTSKIWRIIEEPRQLPLVNFASESLYETSSILATYLETMSLRYRLRYAPTSSKLGAFCADMSNYGRKLSAAAIALPFRMRSDHDLIEYLDEFEGDLFTQLSPHSAIGKDYVVQSASVRGLPKSRLKKPLNLAQKQMKFPAYKCESVSEMLQLYFQCDYHSSLAHVSAVEAPVPVRVPFPSHIFDTRFNTEGFLSDVIRGDADKMTTVPTVASVQSSGKLKDTLESLHNEASRIKISKLHRFKETGLEKDEYAEALESLLNFKDNYEDNFDL